MGRIKDRIQKLEGAAGARANGVLILWRVRGSEGEVLRTIAQPMNFPGSPIMKPTEYEGEGPYPVIRGNN